MCRRRNLQFKRPWMVASALIVSLFMTFDPVYVRAEGYEDLEYEIDENEIWAQIDKNELRSFVDVAELKDNIDKDELKGSIDNDELKEKIDVEKLKAELDDDSLRAEIEAFKDNDEFESVLDEYKDNYPDIMTDELSNLKQDLFPIEEHPVDTFNVQLPLIREDHPLNYFVDPLGLLYGTDAVAYGGGKVEEDSHVLFMNSEGDYKFSGTSDEFKVVNKSNVPVELSIKVQIDDTDYVELVDDDNDLTGKVAKMYFALSDEEGIHYVDSDEALLEMQIDLDAAPDDTYEYELDAETSEYKYTEKKDVEEDLLDAYTFCIKSDCNIDANWSLVENLPRISVSWSVDPIYTDWDAVNTQYEEYAKAELELYKSYKLEELKEEKLEELRQDKLDELFDEKLEKLIDEEVDKLAQKRFDEIKEQKLKELKEKEGEQEEEDTYNDGDDSSGDEDSPSDYSDYIVSTEDYSTEENSEESSPQDDGIVEEQSQSDSGDQSGDGSEAQQTSNEEAIYDTSSDDTMVSSETISEETTDSSGSGNDGVTEAEEENTSNDETFEVESSSNEPVSEDFLNEVIERKR